MDLDGEIASLRTAIEEELSGRDAGAGPAFETGIVDQVTTRQRLHHRRRRRWAKALAFYVGLILLMVVVGILAVQATGAT